MSSIARRALIGAAVLGMVATASIAQSYNRNVRVINNTGVTLTHLYSTNSSQSSWGDDILGSSVIGSGQSVNINFDDGTGACLFDVRARFADGDIVDRRQINVCEVSNLTFN